MLRNEISRRRDRLPVGAGREAGFWGGLPSGFAIVARETYGRISDGMICSARELASATTHRGILVLPQDTPLAPISAGTRGLA